MKFIHRIIKYTIPLDTPPGSLGKLPRGEILKTETDLLKALKIREKLNNKAAKENNQEVGYYIKSEVLN